MHQLLLTAFYVNSGPGTAQVRFACEDKAHYATITVLIARLVDAQVSHLAIRKSAWNLPL